jgi:Uma2 family endonuclease
MSLAAVKPRKWTREEYDRLIEQGVFQEGERLELIEGEILEMTPQNARHAGTTNLVYETLAGALREGYCLRVQLPLALGEDSEPEPDMAVVEGSARDYLAAHPKTAVLVVEVADSSLPFDRRRKLPLYARNGIPEVWIVNVVDDRLEVYREPEGEAFADRKLLTRGDRVTAAALREPVAVAALLP